MNKLNSGKEIVMPILFERAGLIHPDIYPDEGWLFIQEEKIKDFGCGQPPAELRDVVTGKVSQVDLKGNLLGPGWIDIHIHGARGHDIMDGSRQALAAISDFKLQQGVTGFLATPLTAGPEKIARVLQSIRKYTRENPSSNLLGVHLEGPFLNRERAGAQNPEHIRNFSREIFQRWLAILGKSLKIVTLAPERPGAEKLLEVLQQKGIVAAAGHTRADYDTMQQAFSRGISHASHLFNGMLSLHHRQPGTVGAFLDNCQATVELIADGIHLHPAILRLVTRVKPRDKVILVTDAMRAAGMPEGLYELGGLEVEIAGGEARLADSGQLAGSTITMKEAVKKIFQETELTLPEAWRLASLNPAERIGLAESTGSLAVGKRADLVIMSPDWKIEAVWQRGVLSAGNI